MKLIIMQLMQSAIMFHILNPNIFSRTLLSNIRSLLLLHYYYYTCRIIAPIAVATPSKSCIVIGR
jgi:hypothetical protein